LPRRLLRRLATRIHFRHHQLECTRRIALPGDVDPPRAVARVPLEHLALHLRLNLKCVLAAQRPRDPPPRVLTQRERDGHGTTLERIGAAEILSRSRSREQWEQEQEQEQDTHENVR